MAWRVIVQPNGLFGIFNDVVDNFTIMNMTYTQVYNHCYQAMGRHDALEKIERAKEEIDGFTGKKHGPLYRWDDALDTVQFRHGGAAVLAVEETDKNSREMIFP